MCAGIILPCRPAPSEFLRVPSRFATFVGKHYLLRVPSLIAVWSKGVYVHLRVFPVSRYAPPSDFLSPSTAFSTSRRHGLVSSRKPRPGFFEFRGLLSPCSGPSSSKGACPLAVQLGHLASGTGCQRPEPRLRGFVPHEAAFPFDPVFSRVVDRSPLLVLSPPGLVPRCRGIGLPDPSAHDVVAFDPRMANTIIEPEHLQRLRHTELDSSVSGRARPARDFRAFNQQA